MTKCLDFMDTWAVFKDIGVSIFLPWLACSLVLTAILYFSYRITNKDRDISQRGWLIFGFVVFGGMLGIFTGASKTHVVGTLLPAFITLIGSIIGYLFTKETLAQWRKVLPFCLVGLVSSSVLNAFVGASFRESSLIHEKRYDLWIAEKKNLLEVEKEILLKLVQSGKKVTVTEIEEFDVCTGRG